ncbi:cytochrome P450 71D8 [Trifolium repens]|nr:cytochrome P450 71D8 [Trifolium repens]
MSELMKNPRVRKKAQSEIREAFKEKKRIYESDLDKLNYFKSVIKETMRLHPPAPLLLPRECREACNIGGYEIPLKTKVIVNAWALGRDPKYWYDADKFIPERFDDTSFDFNKTNNSFEYIPFGAGKRMCPGILFGLANIELPLAALLYHFDWELPNGMKAEDLDMTEAFGAAATRRNDLHLIPTLYI